jgi:hypothetical protein
MLNWITAVIIAIVSISGNIALKTRDDTLKYPIVDTNQTVFYGKIDEIKEPKSDKPYYGQDANFAGNQPSYTDNGDGTITDNVTGLMWVKARGSKQTWDEAVAGAVKCRIGKYEDWRMPTIKELYSLIEFTGKCRSMTKSSNCIPYLDTKFLEFKYGETSKGERIIDCQDWSATEYVSTTMDGNATVFGVNFADGRIKGYPKNRKDPKGSQPNKLYARYVRGNADYGKNEFVDNDDKTVTDNATGLMWTREDSGKGMIWKDALAWVQQKNKEKYLGYSDWRLPNAKELQSIVDYTRSPDTTDSAAIDPLFKCTKIKNEGDKDDYPFYWTGTTHLDNMGGVYVCFGRGLGFMTFGPPKPAIVLPGNPPPPPGDGKPILMDVHGAGCQRSDLKDGNPKDYPTGKGPQGDVIRILNYVRMVRNSTTR